MTSRNDKSSILSTISRMAKEHHQSVNAAHSTLYGGHSTSRTSSVSSSSQAQAQAQARKASYTSTLSYSSTNSSSASGKHEDDAASSYSAATTVVDRPTRSQKTKQHLASGWDWVKEKAKEHHRDTNAAYQAYYGMGAPKK